ncbi:CocE/NonD family hydrolase [Cellulomonas sp. P24]|uniref:CocE/NonD family hydrolase n=1 Tax=Cellulomonas sp. P24 TaxID=2885206 RepID=UPI00216B5BFA|nr:CocE/NonD family hydrolase [Cellulomonas sp. P24]MCR6492211.1 CocE/NonD family hydrolase [Cellulomonas sp. P24]
MTVKLTEMVAMRDGVRLATDVYLPDHGATLGPIIERTPYGRTHVVRDVALDRMRRHIDDLCAAGFAVVTQDCRGTGDSEGTFTKYVNEADDGLATVAWAERQPWWTHGAILVGVSYGAHAALGAALGAGERVAGLLLDRGGLWSAFHEGIRLNGAFELKQASWALGEAQRAARDDQDRLRELALGSQDLGSWLTRLPWRHGRSPLRFDPQREADLLDLWSRRAFDGFWTQPGLMAEGRVEAIAVAPSLHISSWYDLYASSAAKLFRAMQARPGGDAYLVLGPWTHSGMADTFAGEVEFGPAARIEEAVGTDLLGLRQKWLEYCAFGSEPFSERVLFFVMGGGSGDVIDGRLLHGGGWHTSSCWPPTATTTLTLKLGSRGDLLGEESREDPECFILYEYDPAHPVPTIGGSIGSHPGVFAPGAFDQVERPGVLGCSEPYLPLMARPDVLSFSTGPLGEDLIVAGSPVVTMDFLTSAADTDVAVKLVDHYPPSSDRPDGFAMNGTAPGLVDTRG